MSDENAQESIHCPNCDEDVPETLYCLNCGYPLYKIGKEEPQIEEEEPEEIEEPEEKIEEPIIEDVEEAPEEEVEIAVEEEELEPEIEEPPILEEETLEPTIEEPVKPEPEIEEPIVQEQPVEEAIEKTEVEEPIIEEQVIEEKTIEEPEIEEAIIKEDVVEETPAEEVIEEEVIEEEVIEEEFVPEPSPIETETPSVEEKPLIESEELMADFAPDPMTREVMENLAKNITLKIRLVKLLESGQVKEETFKKLFDSYVDQGKIWISRRDETMRRFKADVERMENELIEARKAYELLEIRRSIGDAGDREYNVKAPAYKWDMEHLDKVIKERKAGVSYLTNLKRLIPKEEVERLMEMSEKDHTDLEELENISSETISMIKDTLNEANEILNQ